MTTVDDNTLRDVICDSEFKIQGHAQAAEGDRMQGQVMTLQGALNELQLHARHDSETEFDLAEKSQSSSSSGTTALDSEVDDGPSLDQVPSFLADASAGDPGPSSLEREAKGGVGDDQYHYLTPIPQLDGVSSELSGTGTSLTPSGIDSPGSSTSQGHVPVVYVDASGVGIGFVCANQWEAWGLKKCRGIQWAEAVAVELGVREMVEAGYAGKEIHLRSDNKQVVDAFSEGRPNGSGKLAAEVVERTGELCRESDIHLDVSWIRGTMNPADGPSRLNVGSEETRFPFHAQIPQYLQDAVVVFHR